jgi:hypothetical protein
LPGWSTPSTGWKPISKSVADAKARLAGDDPRPAGAFLLQGELGGKLAVIEAELAGARGEVFKIHPVQPVAAAA